MAHALLLLFVLAMAAAVCSALQSSSSPTCDKLALMIKSGQFQQAIDSIPTCSEFTTMENHVQETKFKLSELASKISQAKTAATTRPHIEPALQWAQSPDTIFINVKFAHKIDAPACIDLIDAKHEILDNRIMVSAACSKTQAGKHYKLDLLLFSEVDVAQSNWTLTSVGRGSFQLKKLVPQTKWDRLLSAREKPKNVHLWWAMQEKYDDDLSKMGEISTEVKDSNDDEEEEEEKEEKEEDAGQKQKVLLADAAKRVKQDIEKINVQRKTELQTELDKLTSEEQRQKNKVEEELKLQLSKVDSQTVEEQNVDYYVKLFQDKLSTKDEL